MLTALATFYEVTTTCMELMRSQVEPELAEDISEEEFLARLQQCKGNVIFNADNRGEN